MNSSTNSGAVLKIFKRFVFSQKGIKIEILKILKKHREPEKIGVKDYASLSAYSPKIYSLVQKYLKENPLIRLRQRERPRTYDDTLILTLCLYQTLWRASYREVLEIARQAGFSTPALSTYYYGVSQLSLKLFQDLVIQIGRDLASKNSRSWRLLLVDGSGFSFKDYFKLSLHCGESLRKVRSHVRLVILAMVDEKGRGFLMGVSVGRAYALEKQLFLDTLEGMDCLVLLQVVDRAYDCVELLERLKELGVKWSLQMKGTWRYGVKHPLRKDSQKNWDRWGKF